jgi:hypothetical protein
MNLRYSFIALGVLTLVLGGVYYLTGRENKFDKADKILALREIGHELLLSSGDSTSQVLPVTQISDSEYQLKFQNPFSFKPDSLVNIARRTMKMNKISNDYIVSVSEPANTSALVYGFSISDKRESVVPCRGRSMPAKKYNVNIMLRSSMVPLPDKGNYLALVWIAALILDFLNLSWQLNQGMPK